jgi:hypothetical protein
MNPHSWQRRWINALVAQGMDRSAAAQAYASTYAEQPADYSKSPEIQSLMTVGSFSGKNGARAASATSHAH